MTQQSLTLSDLETQRKGGGGKQTIFMGGLPKSGFTSVWPISLNTHIYVYIFLKKDPLGVLASLFILLFLLDPGPIIVYTSQ